MKPWQIVTAVGAAIATFTIPALAALNWVTNEHAQIENRAKTVAEQTVSGVEQRLLEDQVDRIRMMLTVVDDPAERARLLEKLAFKLRELCDKYPQSFDCRK